MSYRSPFEPALAARGAVFGLLGDASVALRFGDTLREAQALKTGIGVVDLSWRGIVEVAGRDRARFIHGMCTNDIKKLAPGQGCMAAVVNRQGKMVAEMIVRAAENLLLLEIDRSNLQPAIDALTKFLVADDVAFKVSDAAVIGIFGAGAAEFLQPGTLAEFGSLRRGAALLSRNRMLGVDGYELIVQDPGEMERILGHGGAPAGLEAFEMLRIANGFPRWGADMGPDVLPMEAGLEPIAISYTKGCYIGQEVIQRVKTYSEPPRMLVSLALPGLAVPAAGAAISVGEQEAGQVTSATTGAALGYVRKEWKAPGTKVTIAPGLGAEVRPLPWHAAWK